MNRLEKNISEIVQNYNLGENLNRISILNQYEKDKFLVLALPFEYAVDVKRRTAKITRDFRKPRYL